jgi:hypothetical protein
MEDYQRYESEFGVIPPMADFDYMVQTRTNSVNKLLRSNWRALLLTAVIVLPLVTWLLWLIIRTIRRRRQKTNLIN